MSRVDFALSQPLAANSRPSQQLLEFWAAASAAWPEALCISPWHFGHVLQSNPSCLRRHFLQVTSCDTHILLLDDTGCMMLPSARLLKQGCATRLGPNEPGLGKYALRQSALACEGAASSGATACTHPLQTGPSKTQCSDFFGRRFVGISGASCQLSCSRFLKMLVTGLVETRSAHRESL